MYSRYQVGFLHAKPPISSAARRPAGRGARNSPALPVMLYASGRARRRATGMAWTPSKSAIVEVDLSDDYNKLGEGNPALVLEVGYLGIKVAYLRWDQPPEWVDLKCVRPAAPDTPDSWVPDVGKEVDVWLEENDGWWEGKVREYNAATREVKVRRPAKHPCSWPCTPLTLAPPPAAAGPARWQVLPRPEWGSHRGDDPPQPRPALLVFRAKHPAYES